MPTDEHILSLPALARRLKIPATWLRAEADAGRLPHLRAGRIRLFNQKRVEAVLADRAAQEGLTAPGFDSPEAGT